MRRANHLDEHTVQFLQSLLHGSTILADDIGIVTFHLAPIEGRVHVGVDRSPVERSETTECIAGEKNVVREVVADHGLRPVDHRNHVETQLVVSQLERIAFIDRPCLCTDAVEALHHVERLLIAYERYVRVKLTKQTDGTGVVRLHVVDDQIINGAFADNLPHLFYKQVEKVHINRVDQRDFLVSNQVRVIGHPVRQRPQSFKQSLGAVIHAYIMYISF